MSPVRKVHPSSMHRQTRRWIVVVSVLHFFVMLSAVVYIWYPKNEPNALNNDPKAFEEKDLALLERDRIVLRGSAGIEELKRESMMAGAPG
jgi:hypothetical protein